MYFVIAIFTCISSLVSLFYAVDACIKTKQVNALYAFARSFSIALLCVATLFFINHLFLFAMTFLMALVQLIDGFIGLKIKDNLKAYGPFSLAIVGFILLIFI
ncbi:hypothetical protein K1Y28_10665 [Staphylococcus warneri]|uniref:Uncharacterized protein n=2 Tax=Staphylococcus warneri TaxID=1292 RepID=A0A2T4PYR2_STAWA|nr:MULTISPECIES: hypothetical protein [Staphylococcus]MBE9430061.1 hypothetical protein [Staphylococcus epidermidis]MBY6178324.1 hypothetical protein [Staphylococcaceae bacterium DP2N0-1]AXV41958.1 hypothetical protein Ssp1_08800 [Staphylococcus sp. M0911]MCD8805095.1 hypothetical protein [Staphylococcus warneri]MCD8807379.1 hypothetical protein [Staphylococcus warneri]